MERDGQLRVFADGVVDGLMMVDGRYQVWCCEVRLYTANFKIIIDSPQPACFAKNPCSSTTQSSLPFTSADITLSDVQPRSSQFPTLDVAPSEDFRAF
jgi:hypothetical protein